MNGMMELYYQQDGVYVYNTEEWEKIRKQYRIIGEIFQISQNNPGLPMILLPEEVILMVNKKVAKLVKYPHLCDPPTSETKIQFEDVKRKLLQEETVVYLNARKEQLEQMIDKIIENKKLKNDPTDLSREDLLEKELSKFEINSSNMLWPTFKENISKGGPVEVPITQILQWTTPTRCAVFADLWEKGYYLTSGSKFGGDFLVYLGDPAVYHAVYIVRCVENCSIKNHPSEIIAFGRLGTSVKKRAVLASLDIDGTVIYITLNWLDR